MSEATRESAGSVDRLFGLAGRNIIVTGAGRGLGRQLALGAAAAGASVVAVARSRDELAETARLGDPNRICPLAADLTELDRAAEVVAAAEQLCGIISGVVHAAGVQHRERAVDMRVADWQRVTRLDLDAPFFLSTALHRSQNDSGTAGSHVFVGSLTSHLGIRGISAYAASKSGLLGVVRTLAVEWAQEGGRVNGICPGYFRTALTADILADPERAEWIGSRIPMGRLGDPDELVGAVIFLLSDASSYVTGQMINIDGGWLAG